MSTVMITIATFINVRINVATTTATTTTTTTTTTDTEALQSSEANFRGQMCGGPKQVFSKLLKAYMSLQGGLYGVVYTVGFRV